MMPTRPECLPCFLQQTLRTAGIINLDPGMTKRLVAKAAGLLAEIDFTVSPPENSEPLYQLIAEESGIADPFSEIKKESNRAALIRKKAADDIIRKSDDPFATSVNLAISGNIIDYGSHERFDLDSSIKSCLSAPPAIDHRPRLAREIKNAGKILYLADNAGELAFDRLLIERLASEVTVAVKSGPAINDAMIEDARACGIDRIATIIENGTAIPGTALGKCSAEFVSHFNSADLIVSKGQGNFETLIGTKKKICYLLVVKCPIVAAHLEKKSGTRCSLGDRIVFFDSVCP